MCLGRSQGRGIFIYGGRKAEGLVAIWDWWATYATIAGADASDAAAAAAGLPPPDSISQWGYLSGATTVAPRTTLAIGDSSARDGVGINSR